MAYLLNRWYAAAFSHEVTTAPLARTLLGDPLVLYRTEAGKPAALDDRCPHRFAPLSRGVVVGETLECGYHGLRFGTNGACAFNPHGAAILRAAQVRSYPVLERHGFIWYWPGDAGRADPAVLPDLSFIDDTRTFAVVRGYIHAQCNYQLVVDNLLDLSHTPFVHPQFRSDSTSAADMLAATQSRLERRSDSVFAYRMIRDLPAPAWRCEAFGLEPGPADTRLHMTWFPPALLYFDAGICPKGKAEADSFCTPAAHCITPETMLTSHYFHASARNRRLNDPDFDRQHLGFLEAAFVKQDEPMLAAVQTRMGPTDDLFSLQPVLLAADGPALSARRHLAALIEEEAMASSAGAMPVEGELVVADQAALAGAGAAMRSSSSSPSRRKARVG